MIRPVRSGMPTALARAVRLAAAMLVLAALATPARADFATVTLQSGPGEAIGSNINFTHTYLSTDPGGIRIIDSGTVSGLPSDVEFIMGTVATPPAVNTFTTLEFSTTQLGTPLAAGNYTNAQRAGFEAPGHPGLSVSFQNSGGNTIQGSFTINSVSFFQVTPGTFQVASLDVNFTQFADRDITSGTPLTGHLVYVNTSVVPEPAAMALLGVGLSVVLIRRRSIGTWRGRLPRKKGA